MKIPCEHAAIDAKNSHNVFGADCSQVPQQAREFVEMKSIQIDGYDIEKMCIIKSTDCKLVSMHTQAHSIKTIAAMLPYIRQRIICVKQKNMKDWIFVSLCV